MPLNPLELAVLQKLLDGDHPVLVALRAQMTGLTVKQREFTGAGFFTGFSPSPDTPPAPLPSGKTRFGDVAATISGLRHGAGFLLLVDQGLSHMLEGYSYEEGWPSEIGTFSISYLKPDRKDVLRALR